MVPSDPSNSHLPAGMQRHRALQPESPGAFPSAPRSLLSAATVHCFQVHLPAFLAGTGVSKRPFALPKRLPVSGPPFRGQSSCSFGFRFPHARRLAPLRARSLSKTRCLTPVRHSQPFPGPPLPFGAFRTLPDQSVQSGSWLRSSLSERSRLPFAPRSRLYC